MKRREFLQSAGGLLVPASLLLAGQAKAQLRLPRGIGRLSSVPTSQTVKWNPGQYLSSGTFIKSHVAHSQTSGGTIVSSDIANVTNASWPNIKGLRMYITWGAITQDGVTFDLSSITNTLAPLKAAGKHLIITLMSGNFASQDLPGYIYNNSAYGPSSGTGYGYWGPCAAIHRANVATEYLKACQAILDAFDSDPSFEGLLFQEDNFWFGVLLAASDWNATNFFNNCKTIIAGMAAHAPHTNIAWQCTWSSSQPDAEALIAYMYSQRVLEGETDTYGYSDTARSPSSFTSGWSWGVATQFGGFAGTDYRPLTRMWCDVEGYDLGASYLQGGVLTNHADNGLGYTKEDILQSINTTYKGTHATWAILSLAGDNPGGAASGTLKTQLENNVIGTPGSGQLGDYINNLANALTNTTYPQNYP